MKILALALVGASALSFASMASASITVAPTCSASTLGTNCTTQQTSTTAFQFDTTSPTGSPMINFSSAVNFTSDIAANTSFTFGDAAGTITLVSLITGDSTVFTSNPGSSVFAFNTVVNPGMYTLNFNGSLASGGSTASGNVKQLGAVPEPATWGLMLLGFGGMGVSLRRSRKRVIAQIA